MAKPEEDWKKKYLESVSATERKEISWSKKESELKKCISRLTFVGDGVSDDLDSKLEELRNRVRGEQQIDQLTRLIDIIVDKIEKQRQNDSPLGESSVQFDAAPYLKKWLESLPFSKAQSKPVKQLTKVLSKGQLSAQVMSEFHQLLENSLGKEGGEGATDAERGVISRLFGKGDTANKSPEQDKSSDQQDLTEDGNTIPGVSLFLFMLGALSDLDQKRADFSGLADRAKTVENEAELQDLIKEVVDLLGVDTESSISADQALIQLVERLDISPKMRAHAKALKSKLLKGISKEELPSILDNLIELLGQAQQQAENERQEVERFLLKLTKQLLELDGELEEIGVEGGNISSASRSFTQQVESHVSEVQTSVNESVELDGLKNTVTEQLQLLQERLKDHKDREEERISEFENRIDKLKDRIGEMESYSEELTKSVEEARAEAFKDALTSLNNRASFDAKLKQEFLRWSRYDFPMSLIVIDVDLFKNVNDTYGHLAGDKVLQVIGRLLKSGTREVDFPARYGGEEFVVLLPETDIQAAYKVAEKIRTMVEAKPFHSGDSQVTVTISAGIASFKKGDKRKQPFARADEALYKAKREGRNRCYKEQ